MPRMEVISSAGNVLETGNSARITQPGSIIKVTLPKYDISGVQKFGNNLVLVNGDNEQIVIEDFFVAKGQEKNKLVIEDERALFDGEGQLYLAEYDAENFAGLEFVPIASMDEVTGEAVDNGETNHAVWIIPLVGAAIVGAAIAISDSNDSSSSSNSNDNNNNSDSNDAKDALDNAQKAFEAKLDDLTVAKQNLADAIAAMQANPTADTIKAVNDAKAALENATTVLDQAKTQLDSAITTAKDKGLDTAQAEKVMTDAADDIASAETALEQATTLLESAQALLDHILNVSGIHINVQDALDYATNAKINPSAENLSEALGLLDSLKAALGVSDASRGSLVRLQNAIELLKQAMEKADGHGINTDEAKALIDALDGKYEEMLALIDAELAAAYANKAAVEAAQEAVAKAVVALEVAEAAELLAKEKLEEALALKQSVMANNEQDRIDEVNQMIINANAALEAARDAVNAANDAVNAANDAIGNISHEVSKEFVPELIDLKEHLDELEAIDKGIVLQEEKTFWEALQDFADSVVNTFRELFQQIMDSKPVQIIKDIIEGIGNAIAAVWDAFVEAVKGGINIIKIAIKAVADLIGEGVEVVVNIIKLGVEAVKDAISLGMEVIKDGINAFVVGISDAIKDAIGSMGILDWLDLTKVVGVVIDVITFSIKNIVDNIWNVIKEIPNKIIDYLVDSVGAIVGEISQSLADAFNIIKNAFTDIVNEFYEAFIKNPFDSLIKPIIDKIWDIITNPFDYIADVITAIIDTIKDVVAIIKSVIELPGKLIDAFVDFVKEIFTSEGDLVVEGDGSEIGLILDAVHEMADMLGDNSSSSLTESETAALQELSDVLSGSSRTVDINLDEIAPQAAENDDVIAVMDSVSTDVEVYHQAVVNQEDDVAGIIAMVA